MSFSKQFLWFIKTLVVETFGGFWAQFGFKNWVWFHSFFVLLLGCSTSGNDPTRYFTWVMMISQKI
jgi:hypothetical protein